MNDWIGDGAQAEYCLTRAAEVARSRRPSLTPTRSCRRSPRPHGLQGPFERAGLAAGQHVLIHGASGGAGSFAFHLARRRVVIPIPHRIASATSL
jgi:NADPH:quinone reductase-like Zn-dependent oxidoreductase